MENKPVTVEPVLCSDRQRDVSSNHAEIQVSRRRKAQDTVQFQSADANHDLEESLQNLEVVEHVEGKTTENNHGQREESQNLHENKGQEIGATGGYSAFSRVQPEEDDDLLSLEMLTENTDGMINTCTIDTILTIMAVLQLKIGPIHDFFKNSNHGIYKANSTLPQLLRNKQLSDMRSLIDFGKRLDSKDYADDINNLLQQYVIKEKFNIDCSECGFRRWDDVKELVNCQDYRTKDDDVLNCIPQEMTHPLKFFYKILGQDYLKNFSLHNNSNNNETADCTNCKCKRKMTCEVKGSDGNPAPLFIVMLPIDGSTVSGNIIVENIVKDLPPVCCYNYTYVVGAVIVFIENPSGSETSSNCSDSQEEQRPGIIAYTDEESIGHYIGHLYIVNPESGEITKKYRYCNSKGNKEVEEFEEEGQCVTFLFFRTK